MTANLLSPTREKRDLPMKRHLVLATASPTIMKIALAFLCCALFMLFPARSRAQDVDQCVVPATALPTIMKIALTFLCCALFMLFPARSRADGDQCTVALPVGSATGCGLLITVTAVDPVTGRATAFTVTNTGNGNPYDS